MPKEYTDVFVKSFCSQPLSIRQIKKITHGICLDSFWYSLVMIYSMAPLFAEKYRDSTMLYVSLSIQIKYIYD